MKKTDYKFWYIKRDDDGRITEVAVRFSEGEVTTENEYDVLTKTDVPVTRYRRTKRLKKVDLPHQSNRKTKKNKGGRDHFIYDMDDFGDISTDEELVTFMNEELKLDGSRTPIDEQT